MIRGTTPLHVFTLPFDTEVVSKLRVIYSQNDTPVFKKEGTDCTLEGSNVKVKLTQEDTLKLNDECPVEIQVRALTKTGEAIASLPKKVAVDRCLENEVLR